MTTQVPAIVLEALASATSRTREDIESFVNQVQEACTDFAGDISRQFGTILSGEKSDQDRALEVTHLAEASVLSDSSLKSRLFAALGLAVMGGLVLTFNVLLAKIVGIALLVVAGIIVIGLLRQLINEVVEGFGQIRF